MNAPRHSQPAVAPGAEPRPPHFPTAAELLALEQGDPQLRHRTWAALRARFVAFLLEQTDAEIAPAGTPERREPPLAAPAA